MEMAIHHIITCDGCFFIAVSQHVLPVSVAVIPSLSGSLSCGISGCNVLTTQPGPAEQDQFMETMAREAFEAVNRYRAENGKEALTWSDSIYEAAKVRAQECAEEFSHTRPDGSRCFSVFGSMGISICSFLSLCIFFVLDSLAHPGCRGRVRILQTLTSCPPCKKSPLMKKCWETAIKKQPSHVIMWWMELSLSITG